MLGNYKDLYFKNINKEILNATNNKTNRFNAVQQALTRDRALPTGFRIDELKDSGDFMNRLMQTYIEKVRMEPRNYIREKGACARWLGYSPNIKNIDIPILFKDHYSGFTNYMLSGLDWDFLSLQVLIVSFIDLVASADTTIRSRLMLGVLIAYIVDTLLVSMRSYFGKRNLARHTLADERFLI